VQRVVTIVVLARQPVDLGADYRRPVDRQLFRDAQVQAEVQERIEPARLGRIIGIDVRLARFEQRVVFRMERDDLDRDALELGERLGRPVFSPGFEQEQAGFIA